MCKTIAEHETAANAEKLLKELKIDDKSNDQNKAKNKG